jgi:hypothetical protein
MEDVFLEEPQGIGMHRPDAPGPDPIQVVFARGVGDATQYPRLPGLYLLGDQGRDAMRHRFFPDFGIFRNLLGRPFPFAKALTPSAGASPRR